MTYTVIIYISYFILMYRYCNKLGVAGLILLLLPLYNVISIMAFEFLGIGKIFPDVQLFKLAIEESMIASEYGRSAKIFSEILVVIGNLSGNNVLIVTNSLFLVYCISLRLAYAAGHREIIGLALIGCCWPAFAIFSALPLREIGPICAMVLTFAYFRNGRITLFLIAIFLIAITRQQLILVWFIVPFIKYFGMIFSLIAITLSINVLPIVTPYFLGFSVTPQLLNSVRQNWHTDYGAGVYGEFYWTSWLDLLGSLPYLVGQFMLAPFSLIDRTFYSTGMIYLADLLFTSAFITLFFSIILFRRGLRSIGRADRLFMMFCAVLLVSSSVWEGFYGGAVRHRMPITVGIILLCIAMTGKNTRKVATNVQ